MPVRGGDPWRVLEFANIHDEASALLLLSYLVAAMVPDIPVAALVKKIQLSAWTRSGLLHLSLPVISSTSNSPHATKTSLANTSGTARKHQERILAGSPPNNHGWRKHPARPDSSEVV